MSKKKHIPLSQMDSFKDAMSHISNLRAMLAALDLVYVYSNRDEENADYALKEIEDCAFAMVRMLSDMIINLRKTKKELMEDKNE